MNKIFHIDERRERKKERSQLERYRGKIEATQRLIQCMSCQMRCAICGHHLEGANSPADSLSCSLGLSFCESCKGEFEEFLSISKGDKRPDVFWHNKEWINMFSAWLNYRQALNGFVNSPEFKLLVKEIETES
jgi:hypothetical protein